MSEGQDIENAQLKRKVAILNEIADSYAEVMPRLIKAEREIKALRQLLTDAITERTYLAELVSECRCERPNQ